MTTLEKAYNPTEIEKKWYPLWQNNNAFKPTFNEQKPYSIMMPPPNVTGELHMGHALFATLQDILIRWKRMQGYNTLWLPGTDHASISTQMMIERELKKEGKTRYDLGREQFLERAWAWKDKYGSRIETQIKIMGASCDWSRNNFTMSPKLNRAVKTVFVKLYQDGLIYRDERLINWCTRCQTALSDLEVVHQEDKNSSLWHIRYPVIGEPGRYLTVATTRPETMLGDTAVAVHSLDERYLDLHGKHVQVPLTGRIIPIICDDILVDKNFGSGAVKVTPAHDFNDFMVGKRHQLKILSILTSQGRMNVCDINPEFHDLDKNKARERIVLALTEQGFLEKTEPHTLNVGRCERCKTVVEPYLSPQWYVHTKPLAEPALAAVKNGSVKIIPEHWQKTYDHFMSHIEEWCISRQLWWGHQIPVWYCQQCHPQIKHQSEHGYIIPMGVTPIVPKDPNTDPKSCPKCGAGQEALIQDPDVLDTWFSSALWPFSTLGWPDKTTDLAQFYPSQVLETGADILFFWVARMMMMGLYVMGKPPFETIYLHAMVRDDKGDKMSKTKGNVVNPLDLIYGVDKTNIDKLPASIKHLFKDELPAFGADALRMSLSASTISGRDIKLNMEQMQTYRAFCNKIWNATRFALMHLEDYIPQTQVDESFLSPYDRYIKTCLENTIQETNQHLTNFAFSEATKCLYHFIWNQLCDWYIEFIKPTLKGETGTKPHKIATQFTLVQVLEQSLRLIHPFMPFISEELWQHLPLAHRSKPYLMQSDYPQSTTHRIDQALMNQIAQLIDVITAFRNIRGESQLSPSQKLPGFIYADLNTQAQLIPIKNEIERLASILPLTFKTPEEDKPKHYGAAVCGHIEAIISLEGLINKEAEQERLHKEIAKLSTECERILVKFNNPSFVERAPAAVIEKDKTRIEELKTQIQKLTLNLDKLK